MDPIYQLYPEELAKYCTGRLLIEIYIVKFASVERVWRGYGGNSK
jgi:hypothetical protein